MGYAIIIYIFNNSEVNEILLGDFMKKCINGIELKNYIEYNNRRIELSHNFVGNFAEKNTINMLGLVIDNIMIMMLKNLKKYFVILIK